MICPYRKKTILIKTDKSETTTELYEDCYKKDCPLYWHGVESEVCRKVDYIVMERQKALKAELAAAAGKGSE